MKSHVTAMKAPTEEEPVDVPLSNTALILVIVAELEHAPIIQMASLHVQINYKEIATNQSIKTEAEFVQLLKIVSEIENVSIELAETNYLLVKLIKLTEKTVMKQETLEAQTDVWSQIIVLSTDIAHNSDTVKISSQSHHAQTTQPEIAMNQSIFMVQANVCKTIKIVPQEESVKKVSVMSHHHLAMIKESMDVVSKNHVLKLLTVNLETIASSKLKFASKSLVNPLAL